MRTVPSRETKPPQVLLFHCDSHFPTLSELGERQSKYKNCDLFVTIAIGSQKTSYYFQDLYSTSILQVFTQGIHSFKRGSVTCKNFNWKKKKSIGMSVMENNIFMNLLKLSVMGLQHSDSKGRSLAIFHYKLDTVNTSYDFWA